MSSLFVSIGGSPVGLEYGDGQISRYGPGAGSITAPGGLPPCDDGAKSLKTEIFSDFYLSDPLPQSGCVMDDQGGAVRR